MSGRFARLMVVTAAATAVAAADARAGSIRHDRDNADYVNLGNESRYASVGSVTWLFGLARGSGTLISPRWVLTAGHVVDSAGARTFRAGGTASNKPEAPAYAPFLSSRLPLAVWRSLRRTYQMPPPIRTAVSSRA